MWSAAAEKALDEHRISITPLPKSELLKTGSYLADLANCGYVVTAPDYDEVAVQLAPTPRHGI